MRADARLRHVGDLRRVGLRDPDMQVDGERGQAERERTDDRERQPQRDAAEAPATGVVELAELRDRRGGRLDAGRQRHRDGEREQHRDEGGVAGRSRGRRVVSGDGRARAADQDGEADRDERDRHQREDGAADVAEPGERGHGDEHAERERDPQRRERRHVGDHRRGGRRDADRDRQHEVDDEGADRHERPPLPERGAGRGGGAPALGEARDELVVAADHERDERDDEAHRRQQQREVPVQRPQRCLDRVRDGRHGVRHHREREGDQQRRLAEQRGVRSRAATAGAVDRRVGGGGGEVGVGAHGSSQGLASCRPGFPAHRSGRYRRWGASAVKIP